MPRPYKKAKDGHRFFELSGWPRLNLPSSRKCSQIVWFRFVSEDRVAQREASAAAEKQTAGQQNQPEILQQFGANENFPGSAAAVEFYRAEGNHFGRLQNQCAVPDNAGKRYQHRNQRQRGSADGNSQEQKNSASRLKPRQ